MEIPFARISITKSTEEKTTKSSIAIAHLTSKAIIDSLFLLHQSIMPSTLCWTIECLIEKYKQEVNRQQRTENESFKLFTQKKRRKKLLKLTYTEATTTSIKNKPKNHTFQHNQKRINIFVSVKITFSVPDTFAQTMNTKCGRNNRNGTDSLNLNSVPMKNFLK